MIKCLFSQQRQREAAAKITSTPASRSGQDPDAAARTERDEAELSRKIQAANEQTRRKIARRQWYLKNLGREPTAEEMAGLDGDRT